jgi:hypothetical protein
MKLGAPTKVATAKNLYADHSDSMADIGKSLRISRATLYRYVDAPSIGVDGRRHTTDHK